MSPPSDNAVAGGVGGKDSSNSTVRISFQGERGAYSEAAAASFFAQKKSIETVPYPTFARAVDSTVRGATDYAILPVENSIEGSVGESYDLLVSTPLVACGEAYHRIRHCLIGYGRIPDITHVQSHPQALGQCRRFIEDHGMQANSAYDTAGSIKEILGTKNKSVAGIASREAALLYGVPVIAEDIADNPCNHTRFLIMTQRGRDTSGEMPRCEARAPGDKGGARYKTSITFSIKHEPGSLYRIIKNFNDNNINMTKIESRPTRGNAWEYNFYVDFEGDTGDPAIAGMLDSIGKNASVRVLGSYPQAARPPAV